MKNKNNSNYCKSYSEFVLSFVKIIPYSDSIGNKGAFIRLKGDQMIAKYTTYEAVVRKEKYYILQFCHSLLRIIYITYFNRACCYLTASPGC